MWQFLKYTFVSLISIGLTLLISNTDDIYSRPESPPRLYRSIFSNHHPTKEETEKYQKQIIDYINYLEEYYVSLGLYYGGSIDIPIVKQRNDRCRIYDYIFKQIVLPTPPLNDYDVDQATIIKKLAESLIQLRERIKEHNAYMSELTEHYRPCYDPNYKNKSSDPSSDDDNN